MTTFFSRFSRLISPASLAVLALPASAQLTVFYTDGDTHSAAYSTTAPNDPLTLSLDFGTALNVTAGTLNLNQSAALGSLAAVTLSAGATVALGTGTAPTLGALNGTAGTGGLTKSGAGSLTLTGAHTYTGATTVSAGTLFVNGSLANTAVTVNSGATIGGGGTVAGLTTLSSGGALAPGNSPGTITFSQGLTLNTGSILNFELGSTSDLIRVTGGTLTGAGTLGGVTLNFTDSGVFAPGVYTLINYTAASGTTNFQATDFALGSTISGYTYTLALAGNTLQLTATASAIPEPSTYAAIAGVAALLLAAHRRRRARA